MQPNPTNPGGSLGNTSIPGSASTNSSSQTDYTSPNLTDSGYYGASQAGKRSSDDSIRAILESSKQGAAEGDKWLDVHDVADTAKDLGNKALEGVKNLSTSQMALGIGVLAAGIAFFITKGKKQKHPKAPGRGPGRHDHDSYFGHQPHTVRGNDYGRRGPRPLGSARYGEGEAYGRGRVQAGSGYDPRGGYDARSGYESRGNRRRDQGPAMGSRYDARTSGRQNPNNFDDLNSAF